MGIFQEIWEIDYHQKTKLHFESKNKPLCGNRDKKQIIFRIVDELKEQFVRKRKKKVKMIHNLTIYYFLCGP